MASLEPTFGHEQKGRRPVLIVSPDRFNAATKTAVVLPITNGGAFANRLGFAVALSGLKTTGIVRCDQPRTLDLAARSASLVEMVPATAIADVLAKVVTIFR